MRLLFIPISQLGLNCWLSGFKWLSADSLENVRTWLGAEASER